jgi:hypothetical protein
MATKKMGIKAALAAFEKTPQDKAQAKRGGKGYEDSAADRRDDLKGARKIQAKAKGKK